MGKTLDNFYKKQTLVYKYVLYFIAIALIVFFFPRGGKFKYEFQKGKPWQYENLYAPLDFSIKKTDEDLLQERELLEANKADYYTYDKEVYQEVLKSFSNNFNQNFPSNYYTSEQKAHFFNIAKDVLDTIYKNGFIDQEISSDELFLVRDNTAVKVSKEDVLNSENIQTKYANWFAKYNLGNSSEK